MFFCIYIANRSIAIGEISVAIFAATLVTVICKRGAQTAGR